MVNVVNGLVLVTIPRLSYYFSQKDEKNYLNLYHKASANLFYVDVSGWRWNYGDSRLNYGPVRARPLPGTVPVLMVLGIRMFEISISTVLTNQVIYIYGREADHHLFLIYRRRFKPASPIQLYCCWAG